MWWWNTPRQRDDLLIRISISNRGAETASEVLLTLCSAILELGHDPRRPSIAGDDSTGRRAAAQR
jgi:hypothetical protein